MIPLVALLSASGRHWIVAHKRLALACWLAYLALDWLGAAWLMVNVAVPLWAMVLR